MRETKTLGFDEFAARYCERQEQTPEGLRDILKRQRERFNPDGWMLLECAAMDSSRFASLTILPYGGSATYPEPPDRPISPRGLASDMSLVVAILPAEGLGSEVRLCVDCEAVTDQGNGPHSCEGCGGRFCERCCAFHRNSG